MQDPGAREFRSLRISSALRGGIIAYGIAAFALFVPRISPVPPDGASSPARDLAYMLGVGLGLQAVLFLVRRLVARHERRSGIEGRLVPQADYIFELIVDAVTVLLFALATFRGIARMTMSAF